MNIFKYLSAYVLVSMIAIMMTFPVYAQEGKDNEYHTKSIADSLFSNSRGSDLLFDFNNINKTGYFYDNNELKKIAKLQEKKDYEALLPILENYVSQFGIQNFYKDTELLWQLAQLYEQMGQESRAKKTYRLVLKHHKTDIIKEIQQYYKIQEHYDDITELDRDYYVPLEYYYELVEFRSEVDTLHPPKSVFLNMGDLINQKKVPDYAPALNIHDDIMIFTKKVPDDKYVGHKNKVNEDLYFSKNYDGFWDEAHPFPRPVNSRCNDGSAALSRDGKTLFFARCEVGYTSPECSDGFGNCDLYVSYMEEDSSWTVPKNMGSNINSNAWDSHPTLSHSEDTLYFASDRIGGFGLSDIYFSVKNENGEWSEAKNMGPVINTRNQEVSPFYHPKYDVFYFSSNGHVLNFDTLDALRKNKTLDIYKAYLIDEEWQEPKNIGPLVNGVGNEFYFTIDSKSKNLFYAKTEEGELKNFDNTDLFSFPLPMEAQPTATIKLSGSLVDEETGESFTGIVSIIDLDNGIEVAPKKVREDGTYEFDLIDKNNYLLVIQGDEFFRIEKLFYLDGDTAITSEAKAVHKKLTFSSIKFENGKARILPEMEDDLWDVINFLLDNPSFYLMISGHTDSDGDAAFNKNLSQDRADAIKRFIIENGYIDNERIAAIGYGSTKPIRSPEVTEEDKRINRRVEFEISNQPF